MNLQDLQNINLQNIDIVKQKLAIQENLLLQKAFASNDVDEIMKAQSFISKKQQSSEPKSYIFDPQSVMDSMGYKEKPIALTYSVLRYMARTPIIRSIIGTRIDQIAAFSQPTDDEQKQGWTIRKKKRLFQKDSDKITDQDKRRCEEIAMFLINGGVESAKWSRDDFEKWLRKTSYDSLVLDQEAWEIPRNKKNEIVEFLATDGSTYRLALSYDDEEYRKRFQEEARRAEEVNGFYPSYVQVYNSQVMAEFYPWELCLGMRNQTTSILNNGYSVSELEDLITIITSMLYSDQYNAKIFTNGAMPKGIIRASGNISQPKLMEFRQQWQTQVAGVNNAHKTPILEADKMDWVDLQKSNRDMEFSKWQEYLIRVACALYKISPQEVIEFQNSAPHLFEGNQKSKIDFSKEKGLTPILRFKQNNINKYLISEIDPNYEFVFTRITPEDEKEVLEADIKKVANIETVNEVRKRRGLKELEGGDLILNGIWMQQLSMQMYGSQQSNDNVDQQQEDIQQSQDNPMMKDLQDFINKELVQEKITI